MENAKIADRAVSAYKAFSELLICLDSHNQTGKLREQEFKREFDRFTMWTSNIGAHKRGQSSLDFRLRDAAHIRDAVLSMLGDLQELITDTIISFRDTSDAIESDDMSAELDGQLDGLTMSVEEMIGNVLDFVTDTTKSLLRLSRAIRNPAPRNRYLVAASIDTSPFEAFDINHVRELYAGKTTPEYLIQRLGRANTARRQILKYNKDHRARLAYGLQDTADHLADATGDDPRDALSTVATSLPEHVKQPSWSVEDTRDDVSETTINTTAASLGHMNIVPFPGHAEYDEDFECPLCCCIVKIQSYKHWKSHQFYDIQPYVCLHEKCITASRLFGSRREWEAHLAGHDSVLPAGSHDRCPLCHNSYISDGILNHVARELQQLALFVLPAELFTTENGPESSSSDDDIGRDNETDEELESSKIDYNAILRLLESEISKAQKSQDGSIFYESEDIDRRLRAATKYQAGSDQESPDGPDTYESEDENSRIERETLYRPSVLRRESTRPVPTHFRDTSQSDSGESEEHRPKSPTAEAAFPHAADEKSSFGRKGSDPSNAELVKVAQQLGLTDGTSAPDDRDYGAHSGPRSHLIPQSGAHSQPSHEEMEQAMSANALLRGVGRKRAGKQAERILEPHEQDQTVDHTTGAVLAIAQLESDLSTKRAELDALLPSDGSDEERRHPNALTTDENYRAPGLRLSAKTIARVKELRRGESVGSVRVLQDEDEEELVATLSYSSDLGRLHATYSSIPVGDDEQPRTFEAREWARAKERDRVLELQVLQEERMQRLTKKSHRDPQLGGLRASHSTSSRGDSTEHVSGYVPSKQLRPRGEEIHASLPTRDSDVYRDQIDGESNSATESTENSNFDESQSATGPLRSDPREAQHSSSRWSKDIALSQVEALHMAEQRRRKAESDAGITDDEGKSKEFLHLSAHGTFEPDAVFNRKFEFWPDGEPKLD